MNRPLADQNRRKEEVDKDPERVKFGQKMFLESPQIVRVADMTMWVYFDGGSSAKVRADKSHWPCGRRNASGRKRSFLDKVSALCFGTSL